MKVRLISRLDNVAVAVKDIEAGEMLDLGGRTIRVEDPVGFGHKVAVRAVKAGEHVVKYGYPIGRAIVDIGPGQHVHVHNLETGLGDLLEYEYNPQEHNGIDRGIKNNLSWSFEGYRRPNGEIGIRNEIWIINTVGCVNRTAELIASAANRRYAHDGFDGIYTFSHPYGCSQLGDDQQMTQRILAGLVQHPNAGGVLVLGLGCENNNIGEFKRVLGEYDRDRVLFLNCQDVEDEVAEGLEMIERLAEYAKSFSREPVPLSALKVGLKCGGSDGLSGITANPLIGAFSDALISAGGTSILTEVPEMFGAETILMNRSVDRDVFHRTVQLINDFKEYFIRYRQKIYENPSPGNRDGGITTLEEKSLGCIQKGGRSPVMDVVDYGHRVRRSGLNLLKGPGNDLVSVTALAAAGAHLILFSTGRGTPFGGPVPTLKISSNRELACRKVKWIDFDASEILDLEETEVVLESLINKVIETAGGQTSKNEQTGYREIAIFKDGVTL